ncbi:MAG TPA: agenet domain-containing protein [Pyrinomonadaceae bacterium]|nr:agenet domain-containing protein [Pyrinomonadaceae bacterium]
MNSNNISHRRGGKLCLALFVLLGCGLFCGSNAIAQTRDWQPQRTWVFVVGTLQWKHRDMFDSFPQKNRRDAQLVEFFRQQGVPAQQLVYLQDAQATTRQVKTAFAAFLAKAREGDLLFVYYCGHGYKSDDARTTFFATYDAGDDTPGWSTDSIVRDVEKYFKGSRAFLTADCCYSGSLSQQARRLNQRVSFACLTSSSASQLSTGNWTFTEMLIAGLSGKAFADLNSDGQITLSELAEDVKEDMAFAEEQLSSFTTTGSFGRDTVLARAERKSNPEVSKRVEVKSEGKWWKARVIEARAGTFHVHYYGYEDSDDEWVRLSQIREPKIVEYPAGSTVEVIWKREWYPAKVMRVERGVHLIHYRDYDDVWDEWVGAERIRRVTGAIRPQSETWRTDVIRP